MGLQSSKRKYETVGDLSASTKASAGSWHLRKKVKQQLHNPGDVAASTAAGGDCTVEQQQQQQQHEQCHQTIQDQQGKSADKVRSQSKIMRIASNLFKRRMKPDAGDTCPDNVDRPPAAQFVDEQCNEISNSEDASDGREMKMRKPITEGTASTGDIPNGRREMTSATSFRRTESEQLSTVRRIIVDKVRLSPVSASSPAGSFLPDSTDAINCPAPVNETDTKLRSTPDSTANGDRPVTMPSSPGRRHLTISDITDEISDYPKEDNCRWSPDEPADQDMSTGDMPDKPLDHLRTSLTSLAMDDERKTWTVRYSHGSPDGDTDAASPAECLTGMRETDKVENDCQCLNKTSCWQMTNRQDLTTDVKQSSLNGKFSDAAHRNDHCSTAPRVDKYSLEMDLMTARNVSLVSLDQEDCIGCGRLPPLKMSRDSLYADKGRNANNNLPPANCQQQQTMTNEVLSKADDVSRTSDIRLQSDSELVVSEVVSESVASEKELDGNEVCRSHTPAEGDVVCSGGVCRLVTPIKKFRLATSPVKHDDESTSGAGKGLPAVETP